MRNFVKTTKVSKYLGSIGGCLNNPTKHICEPCVVYIHLIHVGYLFFPKYANAQSTITEYFGIQKCKFILWILFLWELDAFVVL